MTESGNLDQVVQAQLQAGFSLPAEKKFYVNSFTIGGSTADLVIVFLQNNEPVALVNMSYSVAKTVMTKLEEVLTKTEEKTGQRIMTLEEIASALSQGS